MSDPLVIGSLRLKNRMVMAPFKTAMAEPGGAATPRTLEFYARVAEGGIAMVTTEPMAAHPAGREHPKQLAIHDDAFLDGLKQLVAEIHKRSTLACCHLNHAGRAANPKATGERPVAPSTTICPANGNEARELSIGEIAEIVRGFEDAAERAWWSGYDAIEVQLGHGYLAAQFLSPKTNRRTDAYGGSLQNRLRFAREVLTAVERGMNAELPVIIRVSGSEMTEDGLGPDELAPLLAMAEEMGVVAIHVGMGSACETPPWYYAHMALGFEPQEAAVAKIRTLTRLPIIVAGRVGEPERMERLLAGPADLVALGRPLVADPDLPRKVVEGRIGEITLCGSCLQGCLVRVKQGKPISCIVNPAVGRHEDLRPAETPKSIMVIGGGPAGIEAAVTLARRGHTVRLFERNHSLGGQFSLAPRAPGKSRMRLPLESLLRRLEHVEVKVTTGHEVTPGLVEQEHPDVVIIATGAEPIHLQIPGLDTVTTLTGTEFFEAEPELGRRVLIVGGGMIGMEAAEVLASRGSEVTVVEMLADVARDMEPVTRKLLMKRLETLPVTILTGTTLTAVSRDGVHVRAEDGGEKRLDPVDAVILAVGTRPVNTLAQELRARGFEVHTVGDADQPNQVIGAVESAYELASSL
ncbi:MAG: FAD-dependent oxidoreductase [Acidobacteria bacterium]|nr:FAD-dependent oxidoreductase [Acidobacteriota bacterium]